MTVMNMIVNIQKMIVDIMTTAMITVMIIQKIADLGADTFIVGNIGPHAFEITKSLNLRVMLSRKTTAAEALSKLSNNELELLKAPTLKKSIHEHRK